MTARAGDGGHGAPRATGAKRPPATARARGGTGGTPPGDGTQRPTVQTNNNNAMIQDFTQYLINNRGYSVNTATAYDDDLRQFARFLKTIRLDIRWRDVTKADVNRFVATLHEYGRANATIRRKVSAIRTFYDYAKAQGFPCESNPARFVQMPKLGKQLPKCVEMSAVRKALHSPGTPLKTRCQMALMIETGIRLQELLNTEWQDVDTHARTLKVHGKGNKERTVYYSDTTAYYLGQMPGTKEGKLFPNDDPRGVRREVFYTLKPWSNARQLSPHALRHTFATEMLNNGAKLETVRDLLGHESVKTTERYTHVAQPTLFKEYQQFHPTA